MNVGLLFVCLQRLGCPCLTAAFAKPGTLDSSFSNAIDTVPIGGLRWCYQQK